MATNGVYAGVLERIAAYQNGFHNADEEEMDVDVAEPVDLEKQLDSVILNLEHRLREHKEELESLQRTSKPLASYTRPSENGQEKLKQLGAVTEAYKSLANESPQLPEPDSVLPYLLAAQSINQSLSDSTAAVETTIIQLESATEHAKDEENSLSDSTLLTEALESRLARLQIEEQAHSTRDPQEMAIKLLDTKIQRQRQFETESQRLHKSLETFISEHLGAMIAAEELGGPVVGELSDLNEDMLTAGFSSQGRPKPAKPDSNATAGAAKRQRRIDEIWGSATASGQQTSEHQAACEELNSLLDDLVSASLANTSYVDLSRDSAASRFLVRAKVAQFHPKDARKLRLVDFARELDG
ncbi:hypothetical protein BT63DRAFT_195131 [Microthyrium microscopicum]|uniref:Centromere protein Cenp-K n=1 Tax=Microthyrium microscopicum TaxID=703497 RepID=A0A6A6ULL0_9PEZI|nr:hypothetical protein BT63DRAFT_195131 [Microthyrium microscopicum]